MSEPDALINAGHTSVAELGENGEELLERARRTGSPVILTQEGRDSGVLLDMASYQRLLDELHTLRDVQQALQDIANGRTMPHERAKARLLARHS